MSAYAVLAADRQRDLLEGIVLRCRDRKAGLPPVIVFDLDGTLFDNRPRTVAILHELAEQWAAREPEAAACLRAATPGKMAYLLTESLANIGVTRTELVAQAETFWRDRFFVDSHLKFDVALAGAVSFARDCYDAGAVVVYFTGRDLPLMGAGTFASLRDSGFPIGVVGTELVLKPDALMPDEAFKRLVGPDLGRLGEVVAVFDNEPANCNVLLAHFPGAESCLLDTQHLPGAPPPAALVHVISDFAR
jgi:hypothetical protein